MLNENENFSAIPKTHWLKIPIFRVFSNNFSPTFNSITKNDCPQPLVILSFTCNLSPPNLNFSINCYCKGRINAKNAPGSCSCTPRDNKNNLIIVRQHSRSATVHKINGERGGMWRKNQSVWARLHTPTNTLRSYLSDWLRNNDWRAYKTFWFKS